MLRRPLTLSLSCAPHRRESVWCWGLFALILLGMIAAQRPPFFAARRVSAQSQPSLAYSRYEADPFEKYSFAETMRRVNAIRAEGHAIPEGHPRIFITPENRVALAEKISTHHRAWVQELVNQADASFGVTYTHTGGQPYPREPEGQPPAVICALIYQLGLIPGVTYKHTQQEYGQEGVRHLMDMNALENAPGKDLTFQNTLYLLPLAYDWLYDLLTPAQRQLIEAQFLDYAGNPDPHSLVYTNPAGAGLTGLLASDDPEAKRLFPEYFFGGQFFGDRDDHNPSFINEHNWTGVEIFTPNGPSAQGIGYMAWYEQVFPFLFAVRDQTGEDYFKMPALSRMLQYYTHATGNTYQYQLWFQAAERRPWVQPFVNYTHFFAFMELGLAPTRPDLASLAKYHLRPLTGLMSPSTRLLYILLSDPTLPARSPAELNLPKTDHFEGVNHLFSRSSWNGIDATWLWFMGPTWNARDVGTPNDIVIWKNGGMLLTGRESWHDYDWGIRKNAIVAYDDTQPGKTFLPQNVMDRAANRPPCGSDGWQQHSWNYRGLHKGLPCYHEGMRFVEEKPGQYLYAFGDGAQTLQEMDTTTGGIAAGLLSLPGWSRQIVHFPGEPDVFFLLDRLNAGRETVHPYLSLNFNFQPEIRDRAGNGNLGEGVKEVQGVWRHQGADRIVATNTALTHSGQAHARLFVDTLKPSREDLVYYRMGGGLERFIDRFGNLSKWDISTDDSTILDGIWQVQVGSTKNSTDQTFLHVLQATDSTVNVPSQTTLLEGQGIVGASVPGTVALFSVSEGELVNGSLVIPTGLTGTFRILLADLSPETAYTIGIGGTTLSRTASKTGTVFLENIALASGTTVTVQRSGSSDTQPPIIGNVTVSNITGNTATIRWTTNERADTQVEYGRTLSYGSTSSLQGSLVLQHSVTLTGLSPQTLYHFRARSKDAAGNLGTSPDVTFTTVASTGPTPPPPPPPSGPEPTPPPPTPPKPPTEVPGLIGEWKFDETSGTIASDATVNGNDGTLKNDPQWVSGALRFDGIDDSVDLGTAVSQTGPMSVSAWVKAGSFPGPETAVMANNFCHGCMNYDFSLRGSNTYFGNSPASQKVQFENTVNETSLLPNRWYFIVVTRSGQSGNWTVNFYVNGIADGTGTSTFAPYGGTMATHIGSIPVLNFNFHGLLDDVCLWNRPLTATEVSTLFNGGSPGKTCNQLTAPPPSSEELCLSPRPENRVRLGAGDYSGLPTTLTITDPQGLIVYSGVHTPTNKEGEIRITDSTVLSKIADTTTYTLTARPESHRRRKMTLLGSALKQAPCDPFPGSPFGFLDESGPVTIQHLVRLIAHYRTQSDAVIARAFLSQKFTLRDIVSVIKLYVSKVGQE